MDTALDVFQWKQDGKEIKEIRQLIEEKYGNGQYGEPTPTPPVQ